MKYKILYKGHWLRFETLEEAKVIANAIFERYNIVLGIEEIK